MATSQSVKNNCNCRNLCAKMMDLISLVLSAYENTEIVFIVDLIINQKYKNSIDLR